MRGRARRELGYGILRLPESSPFQHISRRLGLAVTIVLAVTALTWFERDGLRDNAHPNRPLGFIDVFYFTVVSLTTVGYGDIAPVTPEARLTNAVLHTPIRVFLWAVFIGTAYELVLLRYRERLYMNQLRQRLQGHTIVCGFGVKGRAIVAELMAHGHSIEDIVVIDPGEAAVEEAASQNLVALRGDASTEAILKAAAVEKAGHVMLAPNRDDACVLICLTVRSLSREVCIVAAAREEENVKLLYRAGADVVVAPSVAGGRLMAAAVRQRAVTRFLEDLLAFGQGTDVKERTVAPAEAGKRAHELSDLAGKLVLGVSRGDAKFGFEQIADFRLQPGDVVVYLTGPDNRQAQESS